MTQSIPASYVVQALPEVIGTGGNPLSLNGVILDQSLSIPVGSVLPFASAASVASFFGTSSLQANLANYYFQGYVNGTQLPSTLFFAPYNAANRKAYVAGGSLATMTIAALQAISGTLSVVIDGVTLTASSVNLATATSFSNAASMIATALSLANGQACVWNSQTNNFQITSATAGTGTSFSGSISTTGGGTLTVTGTPTGAPLQVGQVVAGANVTAGTIITALGEAGTYLVNNSQTVPGEPMTANGSSIGYVSGTAAAALALTQATGAILSQGAMADTPATAFANILANTQNWASFTTSFEPDTANKLLFAALPGQQTDRYVYPAWDSDVLASTANASTTFGAQAVAAGYDGVMPIGGDPAQAAALGVTLTSLVQNVAAFVMGMIASINFGQTNGRITGKFKSQSGLLSTVATLQTAVNLTGNGYNYYGTFATANQNFVFLAEGSITGKWKWLDPYVDQIYLNSQLQLALMSFLTQVGSVSYTPAGYELIRSAMTDPINQMVNFGGIRSGVTLSAAQIAEVNAAAGVPIDQTLTNQGYYLQILDPGAQVRGNRGTPIINLWYTDGGAVHFIALASIDVM